MKRDDEDSPDGGGAGARSVAQQWIAEARGGRWDTLQELAWSFASHAQEFGSEYEDALERVREIVRGWNFADDVIDTALASAHQTRNAACGKLRRARLVRVVPALRNAVPSHDRTWAEAA